MSTLIPTSRERLFLRAIAAPNPGALPGEEGWWSADELRTTALFPDFRGADVMSLAGFGKSCARKGMTERRHIGPRGHGWTEWRITSYGRGLVADSCIGGGLPWTIRALVPTCPACLATRPDLAVPLLNGSVPDEIPAHPLPGFIPQAATAGGSP
jgi:hypothetical protein